MHANLHAAVAISGRKTHFAGIPTGNVPLFGPAQTPVLLVIPRLCRSSPAVYFPGVYNLARSRRGARSCQR